MEENFVWQDREVRFDVSKAQIGLCNGERVFDTIANVEDSKGSNGDIGTLIFSNLRLIWYCQNNIKINLSVGYECILASEVKSVTSKVVGESKVLSVKCKFNSNRFEFVFNAVSNNSPQLFSSFAVIYKAYDTSLLYRDIKVKGFLTQDKNLITLPQEKVVDKIQGVTAINNDQAIAGTFYLTNVRVIWYSNSSDNFNVSLPWIQIKVIKLKEVSKHGRVVNIETGKSSGSGTGNNFYFKFNDKLESILAELENNFRMCIENPILGVDISLPTANMNEKRKVNADVIKDNPSMNNLNNLDEFNKMIRSKDDEDVEVIETNYFNEQSNILYYMTSNQEKKNAITDIVYSNELGLAIERLPDKTTLESLWKIIL